MAERSLRDLMRAYREGDRSVQEELIERMEEKLSGHVGKLTGQQIRSDRESIDIRQSILLSFHLRMADGRVEFENEKALDGYLKKMVRHKLANLSDRIRAVKRGGGKAPVPISPSDEEEAGVQLPAHDPRASSVARTSELLDRLLRELTPEQRQIFEGRLIGKTNKEIGEALGKTADAVRMEWNRARQHLVSRGILDDPRES
ncbi:MAG: RNA polymerase sigma factor [Planctomycetota bacterium]|jgi:RNA polymerase sigma factor (sigma-70 family)